MIDSINDIRVMVTSLIPNGTIVEREIVAGDINYLMRRGQIIQVTIIVTLKLLFST